MATTPATKGPLRSQGGKEEKLTQLPRRKEVVRSRIVIVKAGYVNSNEAGTLHNVVRACLLVLAKLLLSRSSNLVSVL